MLFVDMTIELAFSGMTGRARGALERSSVVLGVMIVSSQATKGLAARRPSTFDKSGIWGLWLSSDQLFCLCYTPLLG